MLESPLHMLLVEPETLLRRTVALTARDLGLAEVHEATSVQAARNMLESRPFDGALISVDCIDIEGQHVYDLTLIDQVRQGLSASDPIMQIAIMADRATPELLAELRERKIKRVILKPFRAKVLLETIASFAPEAIHF